MARKVLIVEDDRKIINYLSMYCEADGYTVLVAMTGPEGMRVFMQEKPDFVLLDLMLPGYDGVELCRRIRSTSPVPIIMITARGEEIDRLLGLEVGADDYVVKPFSPREVVARMRAIFRRIDAATSNAPTVYHTALTRLQVGRLEIDPARREVRRAGMVITGLTLKEFDLLVLLARQPGRVFTKTELEEALYDGDALIGSRAISAHISHLRAKLGPPDLIETSHGLGYKIVEG